MSKTLILILALFLGGCAKDSIVKVQYVEKFVPVKCDISLPYKPAFNSQNLESAKELTIYYKQVETFLKYCIGEDLNATR